jgi:hypothetical protein
MRRKGREKTPLNFLQAGRTAGPEQRRGRRDGLMVQRQIAMSRKNPRIFQNGVGVSKLGGIFVHKSEE